MVGTRSAESDLLTSIARQRLAAPLGDLRDRWSLTASLGWPGIGIDEHLGGSGGGLGELLVVLYEHGFSSVSLPLAEQAIACQILAATDPSGTALRACLEGTVRITVAPETRVELDGTVVLAAVPWAMHADAVLAILPDTGGSVVLIDLEHADVVEGRNLAGEDRSDVAVRSISKIKPRGTLDVPERLLLLGAAARSAQIAGAARRALHCSTEYAATRRQFGKPIGSFQAVAHHLARMSELCLGADYLVKAFCASAAPDRDLVAAAKVWMGRTATEVARLSHQVHGAIGVTKEHPLHRSTLRLRAWASEFGMRRAWAQELGTRVASDAEAWWMQSMSDPVD
jgi:acyl-CoA dehydrogenase